MMIRLRKSCLTLMLAASWSVCEAVQAAPSVADALGLVSVQKDADYDRPAAADAGKCTIKSEKIAGKSGWVVRDANGQILRNFVDTNGDNTVDQWSYFKDGIETYRDIDSNFNKKADQSRWLNVGGTRWGIDRNEDGQIDIWKVISAEEVSAEVVAAIANQDARRFERLLATPAEIKSLGLDSARLKELFAKMDTAAASFGKLVREKNLLPPESKWVYFGGSRPGMVPASGDGTGDLVVYENASAMIDTSGKAGQVDIGTLVRVGDTWRLLDVPMALSGAQGFTFYPIADGRDEVAAANANAPNQQVLDALKELQELDQDIDKADDPEALAKLNTRRADIVEGLAKTAETREDREMWFRQFAETVLAAIQTNKYSDGIDRLRKLSEELSENEDDAESAAYIRFRLLKANYFAAQQKGEDFNKVQEKWLEDLEKFVADHPSSADTPDAMWELATAYEFAGSDAKALKWYAEIVKNFPKEPVFATAKGAQTRIESVGKAMTVQGRKFGAAGNASLAAYKGKAVVLLHYWQSDVGLCRAEIPQLQEMLAKYGKQGFAILSVSLDRDPKELQKYLAAKKLPWEILYEQGGINGRLGTEMGIYTVPTMMLIDKQGRVINRSIHAAELDSELRKLFDGEPRQANRP